MDSKDVTPCEDPTGNIRSPILQPRIVDLMELKWNLPKTGENKSHYYP